MYCQAIEMNSVHKIVANLLRVCAGKNYVMSPLGHLGRSKKKEMSSFVPPSAKVKYRELKDMATRAGETELPPLIDSFFDDRIRNAFSHSDYVLTDQHFRFSDGGLMQQIPVAELDQRVSACFEFFGAFQGLHRSWLIQLSSLPRYHKWPNYEVLEVLSNDTDGVFGFSVHFSNGSKATYTRRPSGIQAINVHFEKGGTINFFGGLKDELEAVWKVDGEVVTDWDALNARHGE
jgi:hypothetical protein